MLFRTQPEKQSRISAEIDGNDVILRVNKAMADDTGVYHLQADGVEIRANVRVQRKSVNNQTKTIKLKVPPTIDISGAKEIVLRAGSPLAMDAKVQRPNDATVEWFKGTPDC